MSRDGSGGYSIAASSWNPAINGNSATASDWNALLSDMVTAIEGSVAADGQTPMTGNLQMGNNKITGVAAATANGDSLRLENLIAGADIASASTVTIPLEGNFFSITGTTGITGFASTRAGRGVWIKFTGILTLTNSTSFSMPTGADITTSAGDIAGFLYDGTNWICVNYRYANAPYLVAYLAVGGGGGGNSSGGGAGGMLQSYATVKSGVSYAITIGNGGSPGSNGSDTVAAGIATATGGGAGGGTSGSAGGSGGGGVTSGGAGIAGQGSAGGNWSTGQYGYAGGGGAGSAGGNNNGLYAAGAGGAGLYSSISGSSVPYAGGGGGGADTNYGSGANGGVGGGGGLNLANQNGVANTGGGGGGQLSGSGGSRSPGSGGSGIFIIAYPGTPRGTGGTITQVGGNTIHTFTSNGTFTA